MAACGSTKAQVGVFDFIFATAIFAMFLLFITPVKDSFYTEMQERAHTKALYSAALSASSLLILSQGSPAGWNESNVSSLGLASEPRVISAMKFESLSRMNHSDARVLLGIGARNIWINASDAFGAPAFTGIASSPAAFFTSSSSFMLSRINGTGLLWDFYWPYNSTRDFGDSRANCSIQGQAACLNALFANGTSYDTILVESNAVSLSQINASLMASFVSAGGVLVVQGPSPGGELLLSPFGISSQAVSAGASGAVEGTSSVLDAPPGANASFPNPIVALTNESNASLSFIIRDNSNASRAFAAYFNYGLGRVYYFADLNATLSGTSLGERLALTRARLSYGSPPLNASNVAVVRRLAALEKEPGRRLVSIDVVVWE